MERNLCPLKIRVESKDCKCKIIPSHFPLNFGEGILLKLLVIINLTEYYTGEQLLRRSLKKLTGKEANGSPTKMVAFKNDASYSNDGFVSNESLNASSSDLNPTSASAGMYLNEGLSVPIRTWNWKYHGYKPNPLPVINCGARGQINILIWYWFQMLSTWVWQWRSQGTRKTYNWGCSRKLLFRNHCRCLTWRIERRRGRDSWCMLLLLSNFRSWSHMLSPFILYGIKPWSPVIHGNRRHHLDYKSLCKNLNPSTWLLSRMCCAIVGMTQD